MMTGRPMIGKSRLAALLLAATLTLPACVSLSGTAPSSMLALTATNQVANTVSKTGMAKDAMVILIPEVPRKLDTNRVPVQMTAGSIAYLKGSVWTDKPAILVRQVLAETIAARNGILILSELETAGKAENYLSGQLVDFGIDESGMEAVATFDAVRIRKGQPIEKRRFQARQGLSKIESVTAGEALNDVANKIALDISDWLANP